MDGMGWGWGWGWGEGGGVREGGSDIRYNCTKMTVHISFHIHRYLFVSSHKNEHTAAISITYQCTKQKKRKFVWRRRRVGGGGKQKTKQVTI